MNLPAELQAMIHDFLGVADPLSLLMGMSKSLAIPLDLIKKQNECWILEQFRSLFRDDKWLKHVCKDGFNPVLVGDFRPDGYVVLHLARNCQFEPPNGDYSAFGAAYDAAYCTYLDKVYRRIDPHLLIASLRSTDIDVGTLQVTFADRTLSIAPLLEIEKRIFVPDVTKIFTGYNKDGYYENGIPKTTSIAYYERPELIQSVHIGREFGSTPVPDPVGYRPLHIPGYRSVDFEGNYPVQVAERKERGGPLAKYEGTLIGNFKIQEALAVRTSW
ncbi:hypothetical protein O9K51_10761 [Purpureocillium lavendulum]|uniref:F-box domain-containing protein n=1 Tax=Purpureocillium lavendulum TaxID=1247861 RepID=A0AB34FBB8_9HYPO|nr:hypothetical protein O9K51_10761 [Purpureocillium lavendulum]